MGKRPNFYILVVILCGLTSIATAQLPTNVTPGAVEPERQRDTLRDSDDEGVVSVPPVDERQLNIDADPDIGVTEFYLVFDKPELVDKTVKETLSNELSQYLAQQSNSLTFGQLEDAAMLATTYLRNSGYLLAKAILPPQEVEKSTVRMDIFVGVLGNAFALENKLYDENVLTRPFDRQIGGAVQQSQIESTLLRLRDLPGFSTIAVFKPGDEIGETALGVKAVEESATDYSLRLDNHGIQPTGDIRLLGSVAVNNITGHRDRLRVDAVKTFNSGDLRNARINYEITDSTLVHTLGFGYSETRYEVERGPVKNFGIEGDTEIADIYLRSQWLRSRNNNFRSTLRLATKRAEAEIASLGVLGVDRLTVATAGIVYDGVDQTFRGIHRATLTFHRGIESFIGSMNSHGNRNSLGGVPSGDPSNPDNQLSGKFEKVTATYNRLQSVTRNHSLLLRAAGQYSNDILSSLEKMSLGGPYTVRAYPVAEYINDRATFASLAWVVNGAAFGDTTLYDEYTLAEIFNLYIFADYGWGKNRNADGTIVRREIEGAGIQADFRFPDKDTYIELIAAKPFGGDEAGNGDDFQFWFNVGLEF